MALQLILQNERHDHTDYTNDQPTQERVPPDRVVDEQADPKILTDDAGQPKQEGVDDQREQAEGQHDQPTREKFKQRSEQRIHQTKDQRQPNERNRTAFQVQ